MCLRLIPGLVFIVRVGFNVALIASALIEAGMISVSCCCSILRLGLEAQGQMGIRLTSMAIYSKI